MDIIIPIKEIEKILDKLDKIENTVVLSHNYLFIFDTLYDKREPSIKKHILFAKLKLKINKSYYNNKLRYITEHKN